MDILDRKAFNETITYMVTSVSPYHKEYVFYAHMISQCRLVPVAEEELKAPCAINFQNDHYNLYINFERFNSLTLEQRMGKLKEEMLHILYNHVLRGKSFNEKKFDYAADCAVNQHIDPKHLSPDVTTPNKFPSSTGTVPPGLTAEQYYHMVDLPDDNQNPNNDDGNGDGNGEARSSHGKWVESQGNEIVQKDITKQMAQKAQSNAQKARGYTPSQYSDWMDLLSTKKEVDWRQVLRRIIGNKKAHTKRTLMRPDRRNPELTHIKGRTKNRTFELAVVSDVSGSVSDKALVTMWGEIVNACKVKNVPATLVQVDAKPYPPEPLTAKTKKLERKASGGTDLNPAIKMLADHKIHYDAMIVSTDGYLSKSDVAHFYKLNKRILWLIEKDGQIMPEMNRGKMQAVKLKY